MSDKMSLGGIGPRIGIITGLYLVVGVLLTHQYPQYFIIDRIPASVLTVMGILLIAAGIPLWLVSAITVTRGFKAGKLLTEGVYAWARHPLYAAIILFIVPGIVILTRSWLLFSTPVFMYAVFKLLIKKEEDYLEETFGQAYRDYRSRVNTLLPMIKRKQK